jgi:aspartate racemase
LIIGLLGILKAGGAYVPLDPVYPDDRLSFLLRDTGAPIVLTHEATRRRMRPVLDSAKAVEVDVQDASEAPPPPASWQPDIAGADDVAYVMYTSGSTGQPKGVLVGQRAVVRLVRNTDYCCFDSREVFLQLAPVSFDASTFEIWGPLLNGGRLALMPPGLPALDQIGAAIRRFGVTTLWLTAGLFHLMVEQRVADLRPLRQLVAGGDVLSPSHVHKALAAMPSGIVINGYGPTEATTFSCCFRMGHDYRATGAIPIGRPIANTTAHVLDEQRQQVKTGVVGELYVGGDGVAQGYLNDPELTHQRFLPDPFSIDPKARLYRTGDRCRWLTDGNLEFLGRFDSQVKIMGRRIEPGEIEATLQQHPGISQSVVVVHTSCRGDKQLVAYLVATDEGLSIAEAGRYLASRLPPHMVPARVIILRALPLTPNGKVDRAALPATEPVAACEAQTLPFSEVERQIAAGWRRILGRDVGLDENFFDLGGSSLQLIELHAKLQQECGLDVTLTEMFQYTTVRSLAARFDNQDSCDVSIASIRKRGARQRAALARQRLLRKVYR